MNLNIIGAILSFVTGMIPIAERVFSDEPKSGEQKKILVSETTKGVVDAMIASSTGGQKETWGIIDKVLGSFIDLVCGLLNAFGVLKR